MPSPLQNYILGIADNCLILGHRLSELCGHGPALETDIALINISLDLLGQARSYLQYAAEVGEEGQTEDTLAFLREGRAYKNALLVEFPNQDFGYVIARQFFFDAYHLPFLEALCHSKDETLAAIAKKSLKEVKYHFRYSAEWMIRLGDGTAESHKRIQEAVDELWGYTGDLFELTPDDEAMIAAGIGVDLGPIKSQYDQQLKDIFERATLQLPDHQWWKKGGKKGIHTEHLGFLLAEMQWMQRTYPNAQW